ncbi:aldo/keto reductase [Leuconostoc mesenteroides]|uniref:aldo/keto reductase n=1 Tax=Leuconostoc mesenteroides TaxID=1245 RepID=UPI00236031AD|nr:aldo/keto reductase [Leuconostoc mesenteroides]
MNFKTLNNGAQMPQLGFGVFQIPAEDTKKAVVDAINAGYRSIDTARVYGNEAETGQGVNEAISNGVVIREDLFLTTKLWLSEFSYEAAKGAIDDSLKKLGTDYADLILLHQPYGDVYDAYKALAEAQTDGKVKSIGISNFYPAKFVEFIKVIKTMNLPVPQIDQIEFHPYYQEKVARQLHDKYGVQIEAWGPLGRTANKYDTFHQPELVEIAAKHDKSVGQVVLRWIMQSDIITVAKSVNPSRMAENIDIFNFELDDDDMKKIETLDKNEPIFNHLDISTVERMYGWV